jgi:hypothetical protein
LPLVEFVGEIGSLFASTADWEDWASISCSCSVHSLSGSPCAGMRSGMGVCSAHVSNTRRGDARGGAWLPALVEIQDPLFIKNAVITCY